MNKEHHMKGKCAYDIWLEKYGKEEADKRKQNQIDKIQKNHADMSGKNNGMYGKSVYEIWIEKYGKMEADKRQKELNEKRRLNQIGTKRSDETKQKMRESKLGNNNPAKRPEVRKKQRLSTIKRIERNKFNGGQMTPGYNPIGCDIIRWFNMYYDLNFRHAENGGEVCIGGYFPDGVDQKKMTIIEIDEPRHFNSDGTLKQKDIQRQNYLEDLGYTFIRIKI